MTFRRDYRADPTLADRVFELLGGVFPGIGLDQARRGAERFGAPWEGASTPFVREVEGRLVSHVGLLEIQLVVAGRALRVGGVHGVATRPGHRRQGLFRSLIEEAIAYAAPRYRTLLLTTAHPEYFEPFGFRAIPESVFVSPAPPAPAPLTSRLLDLSSDADRSLMHRLLDRRAPLSRVLALGPEKCVWAFYEAGSELRYLPALDAVIVGEQAGDLLRLFDVVAPRAPSLAEIVAGWPGAVREVVAFFNPDALGPDFRPRPHDLAGGPWSMDPGGDNGMLMVRGPLAVEGLPLILGRGGRC